MNAKLFSISLLTAGVLLASASPASASGYKFTDLGTLGGDYSSASAINDSGQVVGYSNILTGATHATIWNGATPTDLGTLGRYDSLAAGINDSGQVVGWSMRSVDGAWRATIWNGTTPTELGMLGGSHGSTAIAINDSGQVVGVSYFLGEPGFRHATIWNGTTPTDLGALGGVSGVTGINNAGQVVGTVGNVYYHYGYYGQGPSADARATIWNGTTPTELGMVGGSVSSVANGINNSGQVVGYSYYSGGGVNATIWNGTTPTYLEGVDTYATGINDSGAVVGYARFDWRWHAFLWNDSTPTDLNSFLSVSEVNAGWYLERAYGINNNGWIVGNAFNTVLDERHGFLLTPCDTCPINIVQEVPHIPEPETYALFMAGLGLMGFIARRRKNSQV